MGTTCNIQQSYQSRFKNKYEFISQIHDHNFGDIKVYRKKQLNYDYVMVLYKYIQQSKLKQASQEIQLLHSAFLKQNQPMALRIFNYDIDNSQISNCSLSLVKIYVQYFNFTLHDLVQSKKKKQVGFSYDELIYILLSCITAYKQFKQITNKNINITLRSMYLSPEGALKFCPIRKQQFYQHSAPVCNALCNQTVYKQVSSFQGGQKYLTSQVKKVFNQIRQLNYEKQPGIDKIYHLFEQISKIGKGYKLPKIQALNITNSKLQEGSLSSSMGNDNRRKNSMSNASKPISSTSNPSERFKSNQSESMKLSLTKNTKEMNKQSMK